MEITIELKQPLHYWSSAELEKDVTKAEAIYSLPLDNEIVGMWEKDPYSYSPLKTIRGWTITDSVYKDRMWFRVQIANKVYLARFWDGGTLEVADHDESEEDYRGSAPWWYFQRDGTHHVYVYPSYALIDRDGSHYDRLEINLV